MPPIDDLWMRGISSAQVVGVLTFDPGPVPVSVHARLLQFIVQRLPVLRRRPSASAIRIVGRSTAITPRKGIITATVLTVLPQRIPTARRAVEIIRQSPIIVM